MSIREQFPTADTDYLGGLSDGCVYRTEFAGRNMEACYDMVCQFLQEEGYGDVPLPANASELLLFRTPPRRQLDLFEDNGYLHNPIKILFPVDGRKKNRLILEIYNEQAPQHLLRFHRKLPETF
jgi:hypothetical protein